MSILEICSGDNLFWFNSTGINSEFTNVCFLDLKPIVDFCRYFFVFSSYFQKKNIKSSHVILIRSEFKYSGIIKNQF